MTDADARHVPLWLAITGSLLAATLLLSGIASGKGAPMLWFVSTVMALAGTVLTALAAALGQMRLNGRVLAYALGAGALLAGPMALGYLAVGHVGSGFLSLTYAFPILITWAMARALGIERRDPRRLLAVALGLAGGIILATGKIGAMPADGAAWAIAASAVPVVIAAGNIYRTRYWPPGAQPVLLAGLMLLAGAAVTLPFAAMLEDAGDLARPGVPLALAASVAAFSVQYVTYFQLQRAGGPVMLSLIGPVAAVIGAAIAALALAEPMPQGFALAAVLTASGVGLMLRAWAADRPGPSPGAISRRSHRP